MSRERMSPAKARSLKNANDPKFQRDCPVCHKPAMNKYLNEASKMWIYKHRKLVPTKPGGPKVYETRYCEATL